MRAFFYLSFIASLVLPDFISAAPKPGANENAIASRTGCSGCDFLQGLYNDLEGPCNAITSASSSDLLADIPGLSAKITALTNTVNEAYSTVNGNHNVLIGLDYTSCGNQLGIVVKLVVKVIDVVLGLLSSCSPTDQVSLKALLTDLLIILGKHVCLVLQVVLGLIGGLIIILLSLLGNIVTIVINLLGSLTILTNCFHQLPGCAQYWPTGLGGSYVVL